MTSAAASGPAADAELDKVERCLYELDPDGDRVATVLRDTLDQLYDGQRSGRWNYDQLHKTEKTHMGTLVEINLHREFGFADGDVTDYRSGSYQRVVPVSARSNHPPSRRRYGWAAGRLYETCPRQWWLAYASAC
ncbi:MAG: NaeI family type II restriction endonuclease [Pseudonocardiales bacterium]